MGTPGQDLIQTFSPPDKAKARWNRAGVPVDGQPGLISVAVPADSYEGAKSINTPERVDLVVLKRDKTNFKIRYRTEG